MVEGHSGYGCRDIDTLATPQRGNPRHQASGSTAIVTEPNCMFRNLKAWTHQKMMVFLADPHMHCQVKVGNLTCLGTGSQSIITSHHKAAQQTSSARPSVQYERPNNSSISISLNHRNGIHNKYQQEHAFARGSYGSWRAGAGTHGTLEDTILFTRLAIDTGLTCS